MHRWSQRLPSRIIVAAVMVVSAIAPLIPMRAEAAAFSLAYIRLDRMKANTATGASFCAKASAAGNIEAKIIIVLPAGYTVSTTASNWTVDSTDIPSGTTMWPGMTSGTTTPSSISGQVVTYASGDIPDNTNVYCFHVGSAAIQTTAANPSQQASMESQTAANARIDYTLIALANITDDQIVVSAVVPPTFIFTLGGYADSLGNLSPGSVSSSTGNTVAVTTNAKGGWVVWAKDSSQGLSSTASSYTIPTTGTVNGAPSSLTPGTEGYVLDVDATSNPGACTLAIAAEYNGADLISGGTLSGSFQQIASCTSPPSPATSSNNIITLIERAAISGSTPAGTDYSDVITVVGAGNF